VSHVLALHWPRRILIALLIIFLLLAITFGIRIKNHLNSFTNNLRYGSSITDTSKSAIALSKDVDQLLKTANLPLVKQLFQITNLNFEPIQDEIVTLIKVAPVITGDDQPKKYLIAFQNSAEARGTGGILGAYAIVELNKGSLKVIETGSNEPLYGSSLEKIPIDVPNEYKRLYGENPAILQNSNLSPHFPYGAEIWLALWEKKFGQTLDGVIGIDPTALSYILRSTGPITLNSGEKINSENLVPSTLKDAYKKFEKDNKARKQYLVDIMNATVKHLNSGDYSKIKMAQAIRDGILANRILFYSTDKSVQNKINMVRIGGYLSLESNNEFRTVIQNIDAGKLDYYLDRDVKISSKTCGVNRQSEVKVKVTNSLASAAGIPAYVLTRSDSDKPKDLILGSHRFKLFIYGPTNSQLVSVWRENKRANLGGAATERGRPVYVADVDLAPGGSEELLANFKGGEGRITFVKQPLVREATLTIKDNC